jgi:hypothetical protein
MPLLGWSPTQVICAAGRAYIGTEHSTFSGYVSRMRGKYSRLRELAIKCMLSHAIVNTGYMDAPDKALYFNTMRYWQPSTKRLDTVGTDFYTEFPALWDA